MKYKRFIPLITPLLIWFLSQAFLLKPGFFYSALAFGTLIIIFSVKLIASREGNKNWPPFIIAPLLFFLSFSTYITIIVSHFWIQVIFLLIVWFLFTYLKHLYYYWTRSSPEYESKLEQGVKLDNLLITGGFLTAFATAGVLFGLSAFLNWPLGLMLPVFVLIIWLLFIQFLPLKKISWRQTGGLLTINVLILTEFAWVFSLLPLNFNILALFLAIAYYLTLIVVRLNWSGGLNRRALKFPLILSAIVIILLLLTARWL